MHLESAAAPRSADQLHAERPQYGAGEGAEGPAYGRYTSTDLQIHLRLIETGLAAGPLPDLSGAEDRPGLRVSRLPGRPRRQVFTTVRRGSERDPRTKAFRSALVVT